MWPVFAALYQEEAGFVVSAELALVGTIGVLGMVAGLTEVSQNVNGELRDVGGAFSNLDQTYSFQVNGVTSDYQNGGGTTVDIGG